MSAKATPIGKRVWVCTILFGLAGQIAWVVENMYFATFAQDIFANSSRSDLSYVVTTLMVIFSALTATVTTIIAGGISDRVGKRKPFIAWGYIIWGITIIAFAFFPMSASGNTVYAVAVMLVVMDCVMTMAGSTSNDAAFNAYLADNTDHTNRGRLNTVVSILPIIAVIIVFVGIGNLYSASNESNSLFFIVLGVIPLVLGVLGLFIIKDSPKIEKTAISGKMFFSGFSRSFAREHKELFICLAALCVVGISQQTFYSYIINFVERTLGFTDYILPLAIIILGAAAFTLIIGFNLDRIGRGKCMIPLLLLSAAGMLILYFAQYTDSSRFVVTCIGGIAIFAGLFPLTAALTATFQDNIPTGLEGRCQGIRMVFSVLIPMIIGPIISLLLGLDAMGMNGDDFAPPFSIMLAGAIIAFLALIPIGILLKCEKNDKV